MAAVQFLVCGFKIEDTGDIIRSCLFIWCKTPNLLLYKILIIILKLNHYNCKTLGGCCNVLHPGFSATSPPQWGVKTSEKEHLVESAFRTPSSLHWKQNVRRKITSRRSCGLENHWTLSSTEACVGPPPNVFMQKPTSHKDVYLSRADTCRQNGRAASGRRCNERIRYPLNDGNEHWPHMNITKGSHNRVRIHQTCWCLP